MKRTLTSIALAGALAIGGLSCGTHNEYDYNGTLGKEDINFRSNWLLRTNYLKVIRADGTIIKYFDADRNDLRLESVVIIDKDKNVTSYFNDKVGQKVLEEAQKQFDDYLAKICEEKQRIIQEWQRKGLEDIAIPEESKAEKE